MPEGSEWTESGRKGGELGALEVQPVEGGRHPAENALRQLLDPVGAQVQLDEPGQSPEDPFAHVVDLQVHRVVDLQGDDGESHLREMMFTCIYFLVFLSILSIRKRFSLLCVTSFNNISFLFVTN